MTIFPIPLPLCPPSVLAVSLTSSPGGSPCPEDLSPCAPSSRPASCALRVGQAYSAAQPHAGDWDPAAACNRLFSPRLRFVLMLQLSGNLAVFPLAADDGDGGGGGGFRPERRPVWASGTFGAGAGLSTSLALDGAGGWAVVYLGRVLYDSTQYGVSYPEHGGAGRAPYSLVVGDDDGVVRLVNAEGGVAWASVEVAAAPVGQPRVPPALELPPSPALVDPGEEAGERGWYVCQALESMSNLRVSFGV